MRNKQIQLRYARRNQILAGVIELRIFFNIFGNRLNIQVPPEVVSELETQETFKSIEPHSE